MEKIVPRWRKDRLTMETKVILEHVWGRVRKRVWDLVERQVRDQFREQVERQVWGVNRVLEHIWGQVKDSVKDQEMCYEFPEMVLGEAQPDKACYWIVGCGFREHIEPQFRWAHDKLRDARDAAKQCWGQSTSEMKAWNLGPRRADAMKRWCELSRKMERRA